MRVGSRDIRFSNPDKVFFPESGLTKGDLLRYYLDVAPCLLHHVRNRPMQMLRYPDGVDGFRFYQEIKAVEAVHASADTWEEKRCRQRAQFAPQRSTSTYSSSAIGRA
jgi:DNA primase